MAGYYRLKKSMVGVPIAGRWLTYSSEKYDFASWDDELPNWMEQ